MPKNSAGDGTTKNALKMAGKPKPSSKVVKILLTIICFAMFAAVMLLVNLLTLDESPLFQFIMFFVAGGVVLLITQYALSNYSSSDYSGIFDDAPYILVVTDKNIERVIDCNRNGLALFGLKNKKNLTESIFSAIEKAIPNEQSNGRKSISLFERFEIIKATNANEYTYTTEMTLGGAYAPFNLTVKRIKNIFSVRYMFYIIPPTEEETRARLMLNNSPAACVFLDKNMSIIECSMMAAKMFGYASKNEFIAKWLENVPEYQPNGKSSFEILRRNLLKSAKNGECEFKFDFYNSKEDEFIPTIIRFTMSRLEERSYQLCYITDLRAVSEANDLLVKHRSMLSTVNEAAAALLGNACDEKIVEKFKGTPFSISEVTETTANSMRNAVEMMAKTFGFTSCAVFENVVLENRLKCKCFLRWTKEECDFDEIDKIKVEIGQVFDYHTFLPEWTDPEFACYDINRPLHSMDKLAETFSWKEGDGSILLLPIYFRDKFWGAAEFSCDDDYRRFTMSEKQALRSWSSLIVAAFERSRLENAILEANDAALESVRAKDAFITNISHEIRTPINAIIGLSEIELEKKHDANTDEIFGIIHDSGLSLLGIVNDILDFSVLSRGEYVLKCTRYNLIDVVNAAVQENMARLNGKDVKFEKKLSQDLPSVLFGDDFRVKQILSNILSNAFKYTETGDIKLEVYVDSMEDVGEINIAFKITDTGIGMTKEKVGKLFTPYTHSDTAANSKNKGTGLGLNVAKKLINIMNGSLSIDSEIDKGSIFTYTLKQDIVSCEPLSKEIYDRKSSLNYSEYTSIDYAHLPNTRVLVVDDSRTNLIVAKGLLEPYKLKADFALNCDEALSYFLMNTVKNPGMPNSRYDFVLMDHMMPEVDGIETLRRIRAAFDQTPKLKGYAHNIPVIALTANAVSGMREMFLENGFADFISKPINRREIDRIINEYGNFDLSASGRNADSAILAEVGDVASEVIPVVTAEPPGVFGETAETKKDIGTSELESPISIKGINSSIGLANIGGDAGIYIEILKAFAEDCETWHEVILNYPKKSSLNELAVAVHGYKSACRNIGAMATGDEAYTMEMKAKNGDTRYVDENKQEILNSMEWYLSQISKL